MLRYGDKIYDLTVKQVSARLGYCDQHTRKLARSGVIRSARRGRAYFFNEKDITEYINPKEEDSLEGLL